MQKRVVVAMSGGVDSSVAAALLKEQGFEVIGITMCFNLPDSSRRRPACCGIEGIEDARRVCHKLKIKHYLLNMQKHLQERVIADFLKEYLSGRTPNPCIRCNQFLKFDLLLKKALSLDAEFLATGHYARIAGSRIAGSDPYSPRSGSDPDLGSDHYSLKKARDLRKDQSYFLYRLNQWQLRHTLFPLAEFTKDEVRGLARKFNLPVADKAASQEICFLPEVDYRPFLSRYIGKRVSPGLIVDKDGHILGKHRGIAYYTIGQRQGLGLAFGYPVYITGIDQRKNRITIGSKEDAYKREFLAKEAHFITGAPKKKIAARVRIRYNHQEAPAVISRTGRMIRVSFKKPQFAVTPGQSAVIYSGNIVLGGGIIDRVIK